MPLTRDQLDKIEADVESAQGMITALTDLRDRLHAIRACYQEWDEAGGTRALNTTDTMMDAFHANYDRA